MKTITRARKPVIKACSFRPVKGSQQTRAKQMGLSLAEYRLLLARIVEASAQANIGVRTVEAGSVRYTMPCAGAATNLYHRLTGIWLELRTTQLKGSDRKKVHHCECGIFHCPGRK